MEITAEVCVTNSRQYTQQTQCLAHNSQQLYPSVDWKEHSIFSVVATRLTWQTWLPCNYILGLPTSDKVCTTLHTDVLWLWWSFSYFSCVCVCVCDVHVVTQNGFFCEIIVECWRQEGCATIHQCGHLYRTDWGLYTDTIWYITVTLMCGVYVCTWKSFTTEASEDILIIMHRIVFMCLLFCHCTWLTSNFNGKVQVLQ